MKKFFLVLLITIVTAHPVSIGSCLKYSPDGQSCEQCILNYHLNEGSCYVDILGCMEYQFGNICRQCDKNYILVNNMCCDIVCMSKIFSKFKKEVKEEMIANNTEILNELIPFAQTQYLKNTSGRLVAVEFKEYQDAKRFFLLYEFYESQFYSKRLIVDYVIKSKKYIIIEWGLVKNSWNYGIVEWTEVQDDTSILLLYPSLYPASQKYTQVVARKAILSEVNQYEIATLVGAKTVIRTLYSYEGEYVILRETETIQSQPTSSTQIDSTSKASTNQPILSRSISPTQTSNLSSSTSSSFSTKDSSTSPNYSGKNSTSTISANSSTSSSTGSSSASSVESQASQPSSSRFIAYELKYEGQDILAELDVNDGLIAAVEQVRGNEKWNHSLTLVVEAGKIPGVIEFLIIGQNKVTGSIVKYTVKYNQPSSQAFIILMTEEITQPSLIPSSSSSTKKEVFSSSPSSEMVSTSSTSPATPVISLVESQVYVVEEGCSTHTYYMNPFSPEIESIANKLKNLRQKETRNSSTPIIAEPGLILRRLVISQNCQGSKYREVAFVEGDTFSTKEYFTYYFEVSYPEKRWYYLGVKNKTQTSPVYSNPQAYPIYVSDPSFLLYPSASLYFQREINTLYASKLSPIDQAIFKNLTPVATSEKDRLMGKISRFAVDGITKTNSRYRMTGWQIFQIPDGFEEDDQMVSMVCSQAMITQSYVIGNAGLIQKSEPALTTQKTSPVTAPTGEVPVSTAISTSVLGDQTVTTTNVAAFLTQDQILKNILEWLASEKPITTKYELDTLQISEYTQALEYHLIMAEKNLEGSLNFKSSSELRAVIIHDKKSHENTLLSFETIQKTGLTVKDFKLINLDQVPFTIIQSPIEKYVLVDLKPVDSTQSPSSPSTQSFSSPSNAITPSIISSPSKSPSTSTPPTNFTKSPSSSPNSSPFNGSSIKSPTSPAGDTKTNSLGENVPLPDAKKIQEQERVKQMIDSVVQQMEVNYHVNSPVVSQALSQTNDLGKTVKVTMVVESPNAKQKLSVVSIAPLESQNEAIIESVKPVSKEAIKKIEAITIQVTTATPKSCDKNKINSEGQEACLDQTTSPQIDIQPGQTPTQPGQAPLSGIKNSSPASISSSSSSPTGRQPLTSEPSISVSHLIEEKSFEETEQSDGEVRKIYVNPLVDGLSDDVKELIETVKLQETKLQKDQKITETPAIKLSAIQLAATNIYLHYVVTLKIRYTTTIVVRRYYYLISNSSSPLPTSTSSKPGPGSSNTKIYMGHQDLAVNFDPATQENRALTDLSSFVLSNVTEPTYKTIINTLNTIYKTSFTIQNVISYRYRVFPLGNYTKVTIKNEKIVGNLHLIYNNQAQSNPILNWHQVPIEQITTSIKSPGSTMNPSFTSSSTLSSIQASSNTSAQPSSTTNTNSPIVSTQSTTIRFNQPTTTFPTMPNTAIPSSSTQSSTPSANSSIPFPTSPQSQPKTGSNNASTSPNSPTSTSQTSHPALTTSPLTPEKLINQVETPSPQKVAISLSLEQKLGQVLKYLSKVKSQELAEASLEQYASTEDKSTNGTVNAIQFDLYFLKFVSDTLLREFICSIIRHEADGKTDIALFLSNDINLSESKPNNSSKTDPAETNSPTSTAQVSVETQAKQEQITMNSDFVLVDPNEIHYPEAISLIEQDSLKSEFDQAIDLKNLPSKLEEAIKFLRVKYTTIQNAGGLRIVRSTITTKVQTFRIYFFKEQSSNNYQIYRAVMDLNTETTQTKYIVNSFEIYANNHQLTSKPVTFDESFKDDTDIAYGYVIVDLAAISTNSNIQKIMKHLKNKYHQIVFNKNVAKIQELKLLDGRINYKILFRDPIDLSEFKFIIFYQPQLDKVLVLNSVNLPHHSQYNQLTSDQQKSDSLFSSVLAYLNSIHPEIKGFTVKSVSKAVEISFSEYQLVVENKNNKYKSLIRIASNNVDLTEINFSELIEVSLDHYKLDQFDEMFIMNYQKLTNEELRTNSKLRIVLNFLYNSKKINSDAQFLGAAYKPYGLGFLYKTFFRVGLNQEVIAAEVYIEAYSDKVNLKTFKTIDFTQGLLALTVESATLSKMITLIKQKTSFAEFTIQSSFAKDFLYGTLYKFNLNTKSGNFDVFVYHDHSTEQISPLLVQENKVENQCVYEGSTCNSCKSKLHRVYKNKCIQNIQNCEKYQQSSESCTICKSNSELINGICIEKLNCGALCQIVSL